MRHFLQGLMPHYFDYSSFVICFEIRKCDASIIVFLAQNYFGYWKSSEFFLNFSIDFYISIKNDIAILIRITWNL